MHGTGWNLEYVYFAGIPESWNGKRLKVVHGTISLEWAWLLL
jgi:hypothetical protein